MKKSKLATILVDMEIDKNTISFYQNIEGEMPDTEFGYCDITGIEGNLVNCIARSLVTNEIIEFQALESLVGGSLGKLAGAF